MKHFVKQKIKRLILRIISLNQYFRVIDWRNKEFKLGGNQINPDLFFKLLSKNKAQVTFVEIGANDGIKNDPVFAFIKKYNWAGILVEPLPDLFQNLKNAYVGTKNLIFENVGISDQGGDMVFYFLPPKYNNPDWLQQIGTFDRDAIESNLRNFPNLISEIQTKRIRTITLGELLNRNSISKMDILIIDAEGFEYKILIQLKELVIRPSYILFEWGCMKEDVQILLFNFLRVEKYKLYSSGGDILAVYRSEVQ